MTFGEEITTLRLNENEILFREGEESLSLYLVKTGRIQIFTHDRKNTKIVLEICGPKQMFGEMAFINGAPRSAWAMATEPSEVLELSTSKLKSQLESEPVWIQALIQCLVSRIKVSKRRIKDRA